MKRVPEWNIIGFKMLPVIIATVRYLIQAWYSFRNRGAVGCVSLGFQPQVGVSMMNKALKGLGFLEKKLSFVEMELVVFKPIPVHAEKKRTGGGLAASGSQTG